jgi:hypothetical protein
MPFVLAAALASTVLSFPGGDEHALATRVSAALDAPTAIMYSAAGPLKKAELTYDRPEDLKRLLCARLGLSQPRDSSGFGPAAWPRGFFFKLRSQTDYLARLARSTKAKTVLRGDAIESFDSGSGALSLSDLAAELPAAPISWNRFFDEARFALVSKACSIEQALKAVAGAIGAKLVKQEKGYRFELDPVEYRKRTIRMCSFPAPIPIAQLRAMEAADCAFLAQLVRNLSDKQIVKFYDGWNGVVSFPPSSAVHTAALERALVYQKNFVTSSELIVHSDLPAQIREIVPEERVRGLLRPDGTVACQYSIGPNKWLGL